MTLARSCGVTSPRASLDRWSLRTGGNPFFWFTIFPTPVGSPLPPSHGFTYLFTMVDRATRWPEAVPLTSTSASDVARAFIGTWVARSGTPSDFSSDSGSQFTSELWNAVAVGLGVKLHRTTAYHPQANGLCERFHHP